MCRLKPKQQHEPRKYWIKSNIIWYELSQSDEDGTKKAVIV